MKSIINGKRYDTDKATLVGTYETPGIGHRDFRYFEASLYKTPRSGVFFLAGEGHAMTPFCRQSPDGTRSWGTKIIPMDTADALEWAEQYLYPEDIETHFAASVKDA